MVKRHKIKRRKIKSFTKNSNNMLAVFILLLITLLVVIGMTSTPAVTGGSITGEVRLEVAQQPPEELEGSGEVALTITENADENSSEN